MAITYKHGKSELKDVYNHIKTTFTTFAKVFPELAKKINQVFDINALTLAICKKESGFQYSILNSGNADYGLFQFIPQTFESVVRSYIKDEKSFKQVKDNFYSSDKDTAIKTQLFVFFKLVSDYANNILTREPAGYYKLFLDTIKDIELKNVLTAYLQHAGGGAIYKGYVTKSYEMITTLSLDILHNYKQMLKALYNIDVKIDFDEGVLYKDAVTKGIVENVKAQYKTAMGL